MRGRIVAVVGVGFACLATPAVSAPVRLNIAPRPYADALIDIGVAAGLSMLNVEACQGRGPALTGSYEPRAAVQALLRGAPCRFVFLDATTVRFSRASLPSPPPFVRSAAPSLVAAAPAAAEPTSLEAVVITTNKRLEPLLDTPGGVSVVGARQLNDTSAVDVNDVAAQIAAVTATNLGPGRDKLLLRGVSDGAFTGRARSTVATYLDDAPITYNAPDPALVLTDVDRIEVLRGPQGALYGGGSVGGVFRIVSHAPDLDAFGGSLRLRGSSVQEGGSGGGAELVANTPLLTGRLGLRTALYDIEDGGFLRNDDLKQSNVDRTRRKGARIALRAKLPEGWSATLSAAVQRLETADSQYTTPRPNGLLRRPNVVSEANVNDFAEGQLVVSGPLAGVDVHSSTSVVHHHLANRYDATSALEAFDSPVAEFGLYQEGLDGVYVVQDVYASGSIGRRLSYVVGGLLSRFDASTPSTLAARIAGSTTPLTLFSETRKDRVEEGALYGDLRLQLAPAWSLSAGGRLFRTHVFIWAATDAPRTGRPHRTLTDDTTDLGFSPKLTLQYEPTRELALYALVSTGERAAGFNTGGLRAPAANQARFGADRLLNVEAGFKGSFWNGVGEASASLFHDRWNRIQTDQYYPQGLPFTANIGDGRLTGVEADVTLRRGGLMIEANTLVTGSELTKADPAFTGALGRPLPGAPSTSATLIAEYRRPLAGRMEGTVGGRAAYVGRTPLAFMPTAVSSTDAAYVDAQLWARLSTRRYALTLNVYNPANASADTFAYGNPFSFGQVRQSTPQRPRTLELVASASF